MRRAAKQSKRITTIAPFSPCPALLSGRPGSRSRGQSPPTAARTIPVHAASERQNPPPKTNHNNSDCQQTLCSATCQAHKSQSKVPCHMLSA
eukprot:136741-Amphidinium_carterae.1